MDKHEQSARVYHKFDKHLEKEHQLESGSNEANMRFVIIGKE